MKEQVVKEWTERAAHDLEAAKILFTGRDYFENTLKVSLSQMAGS
jgi:HEPN domain-containing protein